MVDEADPLPESPPPETEGDALSAKASPGNRNKIIIGVDEVSDDLRRLRQCIVAGGFTFVGTQSGTECLKIVSRIEPRLILIDIKLPDFDGFELARRLRGDMRLSYVPIAFLTARNSPDDVKRGLAVGGNDYILKPIKAARLMDRVQYWTSRRLSTDQILGVTRDKSAPGAELDAGAA
jgi:two-component system, OmpR family, response regulator